jgi:hypothetical protein
MIAIMIASILMIGSSYYAMRKSEEGKLKSVGQTVGLVSSYILDYVDLKGNDLNISDSQTFTDASFKQLKSTDCPSGERNEVSWKKGLSCSLSFDSSRLVKFFSWKISRKTSSEFEYQLEYQAIDSKVISNKVAESLIEGAIRNTIRIHGFDENDLSINFSKKGSKTILTASTIARQYLASDGSTKMQSGGTICWKNSSGLNVCLKGDDQGISILDGNNNPRNISVGTVITKDTSGKKRSTIESRIVQDGDKLLKPSCPTGLRPNISLSLASYGISGSLPSRDRYSPTISNVTAPGAFSLGWTTSGSEWNINIASNNPDVDKSKILAMALIWCDA